MTEETKLAIIMPVDKSDHLREALDSLCSQVCRRFVVYVCDSGRDDGVEAIVGDFTGELNLIYCKVDTPADGIDRIALWQRCLAMTRDEEFFCILAGDGVMMSQNVALFYRKLEEDAAADVYHFNVDVGDFNRGSRYGSRYYPDYLTSDRFFRLLGLGKIDAHLPGFVFRRSAFDSNGGFVRFDFACHSCAATVMMNARRYPICSIRDTQVLLCGGGGAEPPCAGLVERRVMASIDFFNWLDGFFAAEGIKFPLRLGTRIKMCVRELVLLYPNKSEGELNRLMGKIAFFRERRFMMALGEAYMARRIIKMKFKV